MRTGGTRTSKWMLMDTKSLSTNAMVNVIHRRAPERHPQSPISVATRPGVLPNRAFDGRWMNRHREPVPDEHPEAVQIIPSDDVWRRVVTWHGMSAEVV